MLHSCMMKALGATSCTRVLPGHVKEGLQCKCKDKLLSVSPSLDQQAANTVSSVSRRQMNFSDVRH